MLSPLFRASCKIASPCLCTDALLYIHSWDKTGNRKTQMRVLSLRHLVASERADLLFCFCQNLVLEVNPNFLDRPQRQVSASTTLIKRLLY